MHTRPRTTTRWENSNSISSHATYSNTKMSSSACSPLPHSPYSLILSAGLLIIPHTHTHTLIRRLMCVHNNKRKLQDVRVVACLGKSQLGESRRCSAVLCCLGTWFGRVVAQARSQSISIAIQFQFQLQAAPEVSQLLPLFQYQIPCN